MAKELTQDEITAKAVEKALAKAETKAAKATAKAVDEAVAKALAETEVETEAAEPIPVMTVQCTCKNVHLGNGVILKATQNQHGNWIDGDKAEISSYIAEQLIESGQCKEV